MSVLTFNGLCVACLQEGYAIVVSQWSRIYFMTFYLIIMVSKQTKVLVIISIIILLVYFISAFGK